MGAGVNYSLDDPRQGREGVMVVAVSIDPFLVLLQLLCLSRPLYSTHMVRDQEHTNTLMDERSEGLCICAHALKIKGTGIPLSGGSIVK